MVHFRDAKLLRVGLKFTNVSFARVRQIYDNAKIEGWGERGLHPKSTYAREYVHKVPRKSMHAYKGEGGGGGLIFDILVRTYYVNDPIAINL